MKTIVSEKGQITIPKQLRTRLGLRKGEVLEVNERKGKLVLMKQASHDAFDKYFGVLNLGASTDEVMNILRGPERPA